MIKVSKQVRLTEVKHAHYLFNQQFSSKTLTEVERVAQCILYDIGSTLTSVNKGT